MRAESEEAMAFALRGWEAPCVDAGGRRFPSEITESGGGSDGRSGSRGCRRGRAEFGDTWRATSGVARWTSEA